MRNIFSLSEGTLQSPGLQLDYIAFGTGTRPLVMVQGLNTRGIRGAGLSLAFLYRSFSHTHRVYLFDRNAVLPDGVTVRHMARDLAAAMDLLGLRDADVFGVSQGGMIAQYLAIDRPDLVRKLVLAVTLSRNNDTVQTVVERWMDLTRKQQWRTLVTDMAEALYSEAYLRRYRPLLPLLTAVQKPKNVPRFLVLAQACLTCNTYEELEKIQCPVLVLGGKQDRVVGAAASEELARKLGCEWYLYEGLGHAAYEEARDFNRRVLEFFCREQIRDRGL